MPKSARRSTPLQKFRALPDGPADRLFLSDQVSARDAARILGISRADLRALAYSGKLAAERTDGGHLRFNLGSLSAYLLNVHADLLS